jgi:hypothetical protein
LWYGHIGARTDFDSGTDGGHRGIRLGGCRDPRRHAAEDEPVERQHREPVQAPGEPGRKEAIDFWRVERVEPGRLLRLRAEMRVPGLAWLDLQCEPGDDGGARYRQRAVFFPSGLAGRLYWLAVLPFHGFTHTRARC